MNFCLFPNKQVTVIAASATILFSAAYAAPPEAEGRLDPNAIVASDALPDVILGTPDAKIMVITFTSQANPGAVEFHNGAFRRFREEYVDTGKVKLVMRPFAYDQVGTFLYMAAYCSPTQKGEFGDAKHYYKVIDAVFDKQYANDPKKAALDAGFTDEALGACMSNQALMERVISMSQAAKAAGVNSTPTLLINGAKYAGPLTYEQLSSIVEAGQ